MKNIQPGALYDWFFSALLITKLFKVLYSRTSTEIKFLQ
jgi:hypothetical protein